MMPEVEVGTKRTNEFVDEYGEVDGYKRSRADNMNLRLLLVGRYCGAIIGKGGESISRLRKEYNVDVNMPATRTIDRVFTVDGAVDDCISVVREILPSCPAAPYPVNQKCTSEINLLVHTEAVGVVIGKGGAKIKEIREESSGKIKVYQECLPNSNERVIAIGGDDEDQVIKALRIVLTLLKDQPRRAAMQYDPANKPSEILGGGITGSGLTHLQNVWGNNDGSGVGDSSFSNLNQRPMANNSGPTPLMGNRETTDNTDQFDFLKLQTVTSITVPNDMCGAIIGKAGVRIREIRNTSGAKINFTESDKETKEDRVITITGTQQQIQVAEQLMTQCVRNRTS